MNCCCDSLTLLSVFVLNHLKYIVQVKVFGIMVWVDSCIWNNGLSLSLTCLVSMTQLFVGSTSFLNMAKLSKIWPPLTLLILVAKYSIKTFGYAQAIPVPLKWASLLSSLWWLQHIYFNNQYLLRNLSFIFNVSATFTVLCITLDTSIKYYIYVFSTTRYVILKGKH